MEKYNDFLSRISYQQPQLQLGEGKFEVAAGVSQKVNSENCFKAFYGDTVVFDLGGKTKKKLNKIIDKLYEEASECFCERLKEHTLHMTLHDLSAADNIEEIAADVFRNEVKLLRAIKKEPIESHKIQMQTNYIVNMANISLVMALVPADKTEWNKLQKLYSLVDKVRVCPYPYLTPHITLAYFNCNGFEQEAADKLKELVEKLNSKSMEITLDTDKLFYQKFVSMNEYMNVFKLSE